MGIISAAMAAAGNSGVESMNQNIDQMNRQELMDKQAAINSDSDKRRADLETQKQLVILQAQKKMAIDSANQQREAQIARISQAIPSVVQNQMDEKYANANAASAGKTDSPLTPEQQAVIDQAKNADKTALANDPHSYIKAAMATGDIDPHTVAQLAQQADAIRRQELSQQAQFDHADKSQQAAQAFAARQQANQIAATAENIRASHNLDPATIETNAKAIAAGQMPPLTGIALRSPSGAQTMAKVLELKPDYSAKDYKVQAKAEADFATGKLGNSVRSFNVSLSHLQTLEGLADALNNEDTQMLNKLGNAFATQTGQAAPTNFNAVKHIVADEIVKAVTGSAGALGDREAAAKTIDAANSPEQLKGVIASYKELMNGQLNGLRDQYRIATGKNDFDKYLSDTAKQVNSNSAHTPIKAPTDYGKPKPAATQQGGVKFLGFE